MFTFELLTKNSIVQIFFNIKMPRYISDYIPYALAWPYLYFQQKYA